MCTHVYDNVIAFLIVLLELKGTKITALKPHHRIYDPVTVLLLCQFK